MMKMSLLIKKVNKLLELEVYIRKKKQLNYKNKTKVATYIAQISLAKILSKEFQQQAKAETHYIGILS